MALQKVVFKNQTIDYISEYDKDKNNPTVFVLSSITSEQKLIALTKLGNSIDSSGKIIDEKKAIEGFVFLCSVGLKEIKNFIDFEWKGWNEDAKELLCSTGLIYEIGSKILEINLMDGEFEKNLKLQR